MVPLRRHLLVEALKVSDLSIMIGAFVLAARSAPGGAPFRQFLELRVSVANFVIFMVLLLTWHLIFLALGLYLSARLSSDFAEIRRVLKATTLGTMAILSGAILFSLELVRTPFVVIFWLAATAATLASRLILRASLGRARRAGRNLRNLLIVGTNARALAFADKIESKPELGYRVLGFADAEWTGSEGVRRAGRTIVGDLTGLPDYLRGNVVDEVVIALPLGSAYERSSRIVTLCEEQGITVRFLSDLFNLKLAHATVETFGDEPVLTVWSGAMSGWATLVKRCLDVAVSAALLLLLAPLFAVVAALIKLTSPGPVFFVQQRVGLNKRKFRVHKFRTMVADAEQRRRALEGLNEVSGPVFKIRNDPRLTPLGAFLRKTSIDELPQLLDVLAGDMSLVGPRPLPECDYQGFSLDWHRRRFSVRPGITCLWQVNGRSSLPFDRWMELDMQYIDHWSLWLDLKILLRTIPAVLRGTGAA